MGINVALTLFAGGVVALSAFSSVLQRVSFPGPLMALALGVLAGPHALGLGTLEDFGLEPGPLLEQACRLTLAVGLSGVALRLPHGYWRANARWVLVMITAGMVLMFVVAAGTLWALLGLPFLVAVLVGAIITPTDPIVSTPIVTGSLAKAKVPNRTRYNISSESGLNDGLAYLFVMLAVLLVTKPEHAWTDILTKVLLWEVLGAGALGAVIGWLLAKLFLLARRRKWMEETSYLGFIIPSSLLILGVCKLCGTDGVLAVFMAAAVFGQLIPEQDEEQEGKVDDVVNRFFILPVFTLLGLALPITEWAGMGAWPVLAVIGAVLARRLIAVWAVAPLIKRLHGRAEVVFLSWFGPVGISALFYATLAERHTGHHEVFIYVTLAITVSVLLHGLTAAPLSSWLHRVQSRQAAEASA